MYGLTRGTMTLIGVAAAGALLWLASQLEADANGDYWAQMALVAGAGLVMALSQLLGGWTKWGWPRLSATVFLLGFLPALVVGGLVLLAAQPDSSAFGAGWAADLGVDGIAGDLTGVLPAVAFLIGLTFGFAFDTTGPRRRRGRGRRGAAGAGAPGRPAGDGRARHGRAPGAAARPARRPTSGTTGPAREPALVTDRNGDAVATDGEEPRRRGLFRR